MQKFYKGRTNNHLTWVMVDATDFATPESALSAATTIKIYGKVRGAAGVNFVTSGTGSLTNDIVHVGASATGIYTIALVKANLSDASAAWYDQYIITLSATGAARQTLVVDGGIDDSYISNALSYLSNFASNVSGVISDIRSGTSDTNSKLVVMSGILSDTYSMLTAHSNILSYLSNFASNVSGVISDIRSGTSDTNSKLVVMSGILSDSYSALVALSDAVSNAYSAAVAGGTASDVASKVWGEKYTAASNVKASTFGSALRLNMSRISDTQSYLVVMSGILSDSYSALVALSDAVSNAYSAAVVGTSRVTLVLSNVSDIQSDVNDLHSALIGFTGSTASATGNASTLEVDGLDHADQFNGQFVRILGGSQVGEMRLIVDTDLTTSKITVKPAFLSAVASGVDIVIFGGNPFQSVMHSDLISSITSAASDAKSAVLIIQSRLSDLDSRLASDTSDLYSALVALSDATSNAYSAAVVGASRVLVVQSRLSDLDSRLASELSDLYSAVSDFQSDFGSRVPKRVATDSQLSDLHSDLKSQITVTTATVSNINSLLVARVPEGIQKNTALSAFEFLMVDATDFSTPETGLTITATRSIDGGAFAATANAATEVASGIYAINLAATDLNGTVITLRFTATGAADRFITIKTGP